MLRLLTLTIAILAAALTISACAESENNQTSATTDQPSAVSVSEDVQRIQQDTKEKLEEFKASVVATSQEKLDAWKTKINVLNEKKDALNVTARNLVEKPLADLNTQYDKASGLIGNIKDATSLDAVNEGKVEFMKSMDSVEAAYKKVTSLF
ncbi:MAG: hypothetical protein R3F48_10080 [Candidatus Zixiibacteriota bacterium]